MVRVVMCIVLRLVMVALFPCVAFGQMGTAEEVAAAKILTASARQQHWLAATAQERVRLAEALGEEGARAMAKHGQRA